MRQEIYRTPPAVVTTCIPVPLSCMYLGGCIYGIFSRAAYFSRHRFTLRLPSPPELRPGPLGQGRFAHRGISLRLCHEGVAAEKEEKEQKYPERVVAIRRILPETPFRSPSLRFITFHQAQHDVGVGSREIWKRKRYADQIASFLPINPTPQAKAERSQCFSYEKHKEDKLFINGLRKDKGLQSQNWRVAMSDLLRYSTFEKVDSPKDSDSLDSALGLIQTDGFQTQDLRGSDGDQITVRKVISESRNYRSFRLARHISPPAEWSEESLAVYVEALAYSQRTQARYPWAQKPRLKGWTNIEDIVTAFDSIFYSMTSQKFLSIKACNTALRFFCAHGMMTKAKALYIRMEDLELDITTDTFNILLRESASRGDAHNFTFLLNRMTRRGFKPNELTWTLFLRIIDSPEVRATVLRKMAEMNMLDTMEIRRIIAAHMIHDEIVYYLGNDHNYHSFLGYMNDKYGLGWLSTSAGNRLLYEVAKRQSMAESLNLLYEMLHAGFMPNEISMNTLLCQCLPLGQHNIAFEILSVFKNRYGLYPGLQVYEMLFRSAWRNRLLNVSIVIWRTACIYGAVSRKMRYRVFRSLLSYTPALDKPNQSDHPVELSSSSRTAKFRKFAGRFVIGLGAARGAASSQTMDNLELDPQRRTRKWAHSLLETSLRIARICILAGDLSQQLREAYKMDRVWRAEGLFEKNDWREMLKHAITVPVRVKMRYLRTPSPLLRRHLYRPMSATRLLPGRRDLPKVSKHSNRVRRRTDNRSTRSSCKADLQVRSAKLTRAVRSTTLISTMWRRPSDQQSSDSRSRLRSKM